MASQKPGIPKGTRDFSPNEMVKRDYIFNTIKDIFKIYGYQPIETPAMENLNTLLGKYGEEGDRLLFKILNQGNFLNKTSDQDLSSIESQKLSTLICDRGLRYDLTVPFARYVVQRRNDITFPFKRYQIQPVWRGDNPQKGRYREFYQCDADVIGSNSLLNEVELTQIIDKVFTNLNINVVIKINNRKILTGLAEFIGENDKITDITIAIDKLDKIGIDKVNEELRLKGLSNNAIEKLQPILNKSGNSDQKLSIISDVLKNSDIGKNGIEEIKTVMSFMEKVNIKNELEFDLTLARGLNYYTGIIIEVKANDYEIGSICGGGRYDDLTGIFGLPDVSGVGISFGADRIYDVMEGLNLFPEDATAATQLLFVNFGEKEELYCIELLKDFREAKISCELFPESAKMKKQMAYADKKNIPYVALIGENEIQNSSITVKNMKTGEQKEYSKDELIKLLKVK
ncbi:histidine--tRNA ligase [Bacteroidota bacterium]